MISYWIFPNIVVYAIVVQNGPELVPNTSGMVPDTSQTLLEHFWKNRLTTNKRQKHMKRRQAGKPFFFWKQKWKSKRRASEFRFVWRAGQLPIFHFDPICDKNVKWNNVKTCAKKLKLWTLIFLVRPRTSTTAAEEFSQSIQVPSSTYPGTTYPVRAIPHSDIYL